MTAVLCGMALAASFAFGQDPAPVEGTPETNVELTPSQQDIGPNFLANPGFEEVNGLAPSGWDVFLSPNRSAYARADAAIKHSGMYSVALSVPEPDGANTVNNWSQNIAANLAGKTVKVSGFIRTDEATEAALWLQCWSRRPLRVIQGATTFDSSPVYGTQEWQPVELTSTIPSGTDFVTIRCVLRGRGTAWFDDIHMTLARPQPQSSPSGTLTSPMQAGPAAQTTPDEKTEEPSPAEPASAAAKDNALNDETTPVVEVRRPRAPRVSEPSAARPAAPVRPNQSVKPDTANAAAVASLAQINRALGLMLTEPEVSETPGFSQGAWWTVPWQTTPPQAPPNTLQWLGYPYGSTFGPLNLEQEQRR